MAYTFKCINNAKNVAIQSQLMYPEQIDSFMKMFTSIPPKNIYLFISKENESKILNHPLYEQNKKQNFMYIKSLKAGQHIQIYMSASSLGQGVRGKKENIVDVVWRGQFKGVGSAEFPGGEPVGLPINDGDIVMPEPINTVKNALWDAGVNVGLISEIHNDLDADMKFEVIGLGGMKGEVS